MAQWGAHRIIYADPVQAAQYANYPFLGSVNRLTEWEQPGAQGTGQVRVVTAATSATLTDGTMVANAGAMTSVSLTFLDQSFCVSLYPKELSQITPGEIAAQKVAAAQGFGKKAGDEVIAEFMGGTGLTEEIFDATADVNFTSDGTDDDDYAVLNKLNNALGKVLEVSMDDDANVSIAVPRASWSNLWSLRGLNAGASTNLQWQDGGSNAIRNLTYLGFPVYLVYNADTAWGGTDNGTAAIVYHRDAVALGMGPIYLHGGGPLSASDGTVKYIWLQPTCYGDVQSKWCEVMNEST